MKHNLSTEKKKEIIKRLTKIKQLLKQLKKELKGAVAAEFNLSSVNMGGNTFKTRL